MTAQIFQIRDYQPTSTRLRLLSNEIFAAIGIGLVGQFTPFDEVTLRRGLVIDSEPSGTESAPMMPIARDTAERDHAARHGRLGADLYSSQEPNAAPYGNSPREIAKRRLKAFQHIDSEPCEMNPDDCA